MAKAPGENREVFSGLMKRCGLTHNSADISFEIWRFQNLPAKLAMAME